MRPEKAVSTTLAALICVYCTSPEPEGHGTLIWAGIIMSQTKAASPLRPVAFQLSSSHSQFIFSLTFAASSLSPISFLINLFVAFLIIACVVQFTGNIWAGVVQNVMANTLVNLYMLSVRPEDVLIADPSDLPLEALVALLVVVGLLITGRKITTSAREDRSEV